LDRLTVNQTKILLNPGGESSYTRESRAIERDLDSIFDADQADAGATLVRLGIALAQINLFIWLERASMGESAQTFGEHLKLAHQLNGLRNQIKNRVSELEASSGVSGAKSNTGTDGLEGWRLSVLGRHEDPR
jgi:hypothetical protein